MPPGSNRQGRIAVVVPQHVLLAHPTSTVLVPKDQQPLVSHPLNPCQAALTIPEGSPFQQSHKPHRETMKESQTPSTACWGSARQSSTWGWMREQLLLKPDQTHSTGTGGWDAQLHTQKCRMRAPMQPQKQHETSHPHLQHRGSLCS